MTSTPSISPDKARAAQEHEDLAAEALHRAARVTTTDEPERTASITHYQQRADHHTARARTLRTPNP
ncbi:hypothetical protein [Streptomyces sp. NPDC059076]|uniref:hypothetical protein n=1 Tax=unclassified Streptomyces TaxID=2593676 RepID=UPI0036C4AF9A